MLSEEQMGKSEGQRGDIGWFYVEKPTVELLSYSSFSKQQLQHSSEPVHDDYGDESGLR